MQKHATTIIGVLAIVVIAVAVYRLVPHRPAVRHSANEIPASQWKDRGEKDPKSAIISASAAVRKGDAQTLVDFFTPELRKSWEFGAQDAMQKQNKTLAQLLSTHFPKTPGDAEIQIVKLQPLGDKWARAIIKVSAGGKPQTLTVVLRKIDGAWKIDDFQ